MSAFSARENLLERPRWGRKAATCIRQPTIADICTTRDDIHLASFGGIGGECGIRLPHRLRDLPRNHTTRLHWPVRGLESTRDAPSIGVPSKFPETKPTSSRKRCCDRGLGIMPSCTFESCPPLHLICVPVGLASWRPLDDTEMVDFIRRQGEKADHVTYVCMGAFLLDAAGLLKGRRAATNWSYVDLLPMVGARHERGRVVRDGNVFTWARSLRESTSHLALWPNLPARRSHEPSSSALSMTRLLPSTPAILTRRARRQLRHSSTKQKAYTGFGRRLRTWPALAEIAKRCCRQRRIFATQYSPTFLGPLSNCVTATSSPVAGAMPPHPQRYSAGTYGGARNMSVALAREAAGSRLYCLMRITPPEA